MCQSGNELLLLLLLLLHALLHVDVQGENEGRSGKLAGLDFTVAD